MADDELVVSDVLCFMRHKFGKLSSKVLKTVVTDFYSADALGTAKIMLINDVGKLSSLINLPHIPQRRDGDGRLSKEFDDLLSVFTLLDEQKVLDKLPRYVTDSPDNIPSVRLYEGDLGAMFTLLNKLRDKMADYGSALNKISHDIQELQIQVRSRPTSLASQPVSQPVGQGSAQVRSTGQSAWSVCKPLPGNPSIDSQAEESSSVARSADGVGIQSPTTRNVPSWAVLSSSPVITDNRFAALQPSDDDDGERPDDQQQTQPFIVVSSRRNKRARQGSSPRSAAQSDRDAATSQQKTQQQQQRQQQRQPQRQRLLGKSTSAATVVTAARIIRKKSVFCIDNVNPACSTDDIRSFVAGKLSVQVYSCFEAKPRRRGKFDNPDFKRKAFRLCICADDCDKLLNASMWPDSVVISEWFFKPERNTAATADTDHRNAGTIIAEDADQRAEVDATTGDVSSAEDDDATILSAHSVATMDTSTTVHDG